MIARIGKYEVQSIIGEGAFGRVFRAVDPTIPRDVAIKVLIADSDPGILARFRAEAGAAGKLNHKNIVTVYECGDYEGKPFIAMELLDGKSLQEKIVLREPPGLLDKLRILVQVAEGLACAHAAGIVHRDVKPANIMVRSNGDVKIMDFGIARVTGEMGARLTRQGDMPGTIPYMSPERFKSDADACSDIFSFGVVAYEFITGKNPFEGKNWAEVYYNITSLEPAPLRQLVPECPEALELVVQRAMAKDRESRYQSMEEILFDLPPVVHELEQQRAASLMRDVRSLVETGQISLAQDKVREVLKLDPSNREARRVHESLREDERHKRLREQLDTLIHDGEAQLGQRNFSAAIDAFKSALRLDASATNVRSLLDRASAAWEANRQANRLISEARHELLAGNLDAAYVQAAGALNAAPDNPDAVALCEKLRQQMEQRDRQIRVDNALHRAEALLAGNDFKGARGVLAEVEREADPEAVATLRSRIDRAEAEQLRRAREARLHAGIAKARQHLVCDEFAETRETLRSVLEEFPDSTTARDLVVTLEEREAAERRREMIGGLTQQALSLIQSQSFPEAIRLLESGLREYPEDAGLGRLLDRARALKSAGERAEAIRQTLAQAQKLRETQRIDEALSLIAAALAKYGSDDALAGLKRQIESDRERERYAAALNEAAAKGRELMAQGRLDEAVAALEKSLAAYPGEAAIRSLLKSARQAKAAQEEEKRRRQTVAERREKIEQAIAAGDWPRAELSLKLARQDFPGETAFDGLDEKCRQGQLQALAEQRERERLQAYHDSLERARQSARQGDHLAAEGLLEQLIRDNPPDQEAATLLGVLRAARLRQEAYQRALEDAETLRAAGDLGKAEQALRQALREAPDSRAADLLQAVIAEREQLERQRRLEQGKKEIRALVEGGDDSGALAALDKLQRDFPGDAELAELRRAAAEHEQARRREAERARRIASHRAAVEAAISARDWAGARKALDAAHEEYPAEPVFSQFREEIARQSRRDALAQFETNVRQGFTHGDLDRAAREIAAARAEFSEEHVWQTLNDELGLRRLYNTLLLEAERLSNEGDLETARQKLREAISLDPTDNRAAALLERLASGRKLKVRGAWHKWLAVGAGAAVVAAAAIVAYVLYPPGANPGPEASAPAITLQAAPAQLRFSSTVGKPDPAPKAVNLEPAGVRFQATASDDWLTAAPQQNGNRLEVRVKTKGLDPGEYSGNLMVRAPDRVVKNDPLFISVRLVVKDFGREKEPVEAPKPVPFKLEPARLIFTHTQNGPAPGSQQIRAVEGDIGRANASPQSGWLRVEQLGKKTVRISVNPPGPGEYEGAIAVAAADGRVSVQVPVHLTVHPMPKTVEVAKNPEPKPPVPTPTPVQTPPSTPPPPPVPAGPGCSDRMPNTAKEGLVTWHGTLPPGGVVDIGYNRVSAGHVDDPFSLPPPRQPLAIGNHSAEVKIEQVPQLQNQCGVLRFRNQSSGTVTKFIFDWQLDRK